MGNHNDKKTGSGMIAVSTIMVAVVVIAVIFTFILLRKKEESHIASAKDTGQTESTIVISGSEDAGETVEADESTDEIYLIEGDEQGSNRYEKANRLSYTDSVRYTQEQLSWLDSNGLLITRNEIYARHGKMFNDQVLQDYFELQDWYVAQYSSSAFDESCLNEVEQYNIELIASYELQQGY